jgi:hypothetical protein
MLRASLLDQVTHSLPVESHEIVHVLQLRLIRHVRRDTESDGNEKYSMVNQCLGSCLVIDKSQRSLSFDWIGRSLLDLVNEIVNVPGLVRIHIRRTNGSSRSVLSQSAIEQIPAGVDRLFLKVGQDNGCPLTANTVDT